MAFHIIRAFLLPTRGSFFGIFNKLVLFRLLLPFYHVALALFPAPYSRTQDSLSYARWPKFDAALLVEDTLEIPVQVNGKLRVVIRVPANATQADLGNGGKNSVEVKPFTDNEKIKKIIVVPKKLVNIVAV